MSTLVLLRSGQSQWNAQNRYTGWYDANITKRGANEAIEAGTTLKAANILPDVVHTSVQTRAIKTANLAQRETDRLWIPVRRHWRLNERHCGALTGLERSEAVDTYGEERIRLWHRTYDTPPPEMPPHHPHNPNVDRRYAHLAADVVPTAECLRDVVDRTLPYWFDAIIPDLERHRTVLVAAHDGSVRALVKHLSGLSDDDIPDVSIPNAVPLIYQIDPDGRAVDEMPIEHRYLR